MSVNLDKSDTLAAEAAQIGVGHGWNHANFVAAYGGNMDEEPQVPAQFLTVETYYTAAYAEGVQRFIDGQFSDGTPQED